MTEFAWKLAAAVRCLFKCCGAKTRHGGRSAIRGTRILRSGFYVLQVHRYLSFFRFRTYRCHCIRHKLHPETFQAHYRWHISFLERMWVSCRLDYPESLGILLAPYQRSNRQRVASDFSSSHPFKLPKRFTLGALAY